VGLEVPVSDCYKHHPGAVQYQRPPIDRSNDAPSQQEMYWLMQRRDADLSHLSLPWGEELSGV